MLGGDSVLLATIETADGCELLDDVVRGTGPLWLCTDASGAVAAAYAPGSDGGRLYDVRPARPGAEGVAAGTGPEMSPAVVQEAWQRWWAQRRTASIELAIALVAFVAAGVLVVVVATADGRPATAAVVLLVLSGLVAVVSFLLAWGDDVRSVARARRVRAQLGGSWRPYEGRLQHRSWVELSGEAPSGSSTEHRWALVAGDDTRVLLDEDGPSSALSAVLDGNASVWVTGSLDGDPVVVVPFGPDLFITRTVRGERRRAQVEGRSSRLRPRSGHALETSPPLPRRGA
ncbi:hypothetical protein GCM10023340_32020 [Nocardioides marinquilinus]|uniref:Uncharacterized protein n=1 Tax=Nocardioides marinquilinus TaxID=1210400 RepID=A0ABP9PTY9_9ACTN